MARKEYIQRRTPVQPSRRRYSSRKKSGPPPILIIALVLVVALVVGVVILVANSGKKNTPAEDQNLPSSSASEPAQSTPEESASSGQETSSETAASTATPEPVTSATPPPERIPTGTPEQLEALLRIGDTGYEYYNFVLDYANEYITVVTDAQKTLPSGTTLYDVVIPTSMDIMLSSDYINEHGINSSDQQAAIQYLYESINGLNPAVKTVPLYDALKLHNNEYIYFRTDHHWTQLGAYYAYVEFCKAKGITPKALTDFDTASYPGFLGSFYNDSPNADMEANPDTVEAYKPRGDVHMTVTQSDGELLEDWPVVNDDTYYEDAGSKYLIFAAGDQPYEEIVNNDLTDGSSCLLIKESFGNCFVPFLTSHYQTVYVVDYRLYPGDISDLVAEKGIQDVILMNNISMTRNESLIDDLRVTF